MEDDLKKLGRIATPKPSEEARARAMSAAMAAFEAEKEIYNGTPRNGREASSKLHRNETMEPVHVPAN